MIRSKWVRGVISSCCNFVRTPMTAYLEGQVKVMGGDGRRSGGVGRCAGEMDTDGMLQTQFRQREYFVANNLLQAAHLESFRMALLV
jgi:hypothetical protein